VLVLALCVVNIFDIFLLRCCGGKYDYFARAKTEVRRG
jgi:hypothetical protein